MINPYSLSIRYKVFGNVRWPFDLDHSIPVVIPRHQYCPIQGDSFLHLLLLFIWPVLFDYIHRDDRYVWPLPVIIRPHSILSLKTWLIVIIHHFDPVTMLHSINDRPDDHIRHLMAPVTIPRWSLLLMMTIVVDPRWRYHTIPWYVCYDWFGDISLHSVMSIPHWHCCCCYSMIYTLTGDDDDWPVIDIPFIPCRRFGNTFPRRYICSIHSTGGRHSSIIPIDVGDIDWNCWKLLLISKYQWYLLVMTHCYLLLLLLNPLMVLTLLLLLLIFIDIVIIVLEKSPFPEGTFIPLFHSFIRLTWFLIRLHLLLIHCVVDLLTDRCCCRYLKAIRVGTIK